MNAGEIQADLAERADPQDAVNLQRYFKTGPGEYGEGDLFRGIRVPVLRRLARQYRATPVEEAVALLTSPYHEDRLLALFLLVYRFKRGDEGMQARIYDLYLGHTPFVNNWDLVDLSAGHIVGGYLWERDRAPLDRLVASPLLWERRIAVLATSHFISRGDFADTLRLSERLLQDREDLIHKAVGWMLREIGKRDFTVEEAFLQRHNKRMPRTMLRYAIEKFPEPRRQAYLKGTV